MSTATGIRQPKGLQSAWRRHLARGCQWHSGSLSIFAISLLSCAARIFFFVLSSTALSAWIVEIEVAASPVNHRCLVVGSRFMIQVNPYPRKSNILIYQQAWWVALKNVFFWLGILETSVKTQCSRKNPSLINPCCTSRLESHTDSWARGVVSMNMVF